MPTNLRVRFIIQGVILFSLFFLFGKLGIHMTALTGSSAFIWFPAGIGLAALVLIDQRLWPWIFFAALALRATSGHSFSPVLAVGMGCGAVFECLVGSYFIRKYCGPIPTFSKVREVLSFVVVVALSTLVGTTIKVGGALLSGGIPFDQAMITLRPWWLAGGVGELLVGGSIICWYNHGRFHFSQLAKSKGTALAVAVAVISLSLFVYTPLAAHNHSLIIRPFMIYFLLVWATIRFDLLGAIFTFLTVGSIETGGILLGYTSPALLPHDEQIILQQTYLFTIGMVGLIIGAAIREREDALEARNEFLSITSHELRTPITSIALHLQLFHRQLLDQTDKSLTEAKHVRSLERANNQMKRLTNRLEQLLDLSRLERRDLRLRPNDLDLSELILGLTERIEQEAARAGCPISTRLQDQIQCFWDPLRVEQVIENLVSNAIKYAPGRPILIRTSESDGVAKICVEDSGPGIEKSVLPFVFDRFVRASRTSDVKGLGLGLFISRQIVEAHGGKIWVESAVGEGARFYLELPCDNRKKEIGAEAGTESKYEA